MAATYNLISSYTVVGSSTSSVVMNTIPSTYDHLIINISSRANYSGVYHLNALVQTNSQSTSSTYSGRFAYNSSSASIATQTSDPTGIWISGANGSSTNYFSNNWSFIGNYNSSAGPSSRPYVGVQEAIGGALVIFGKSQPGTAAAVTSLTFKELSSNNFVEGSTFYLYGIKNT